MSYTTDIWTACKALQKIWTRTAKVKNINVMSIPRESDIFSGNKIAFVYPVSATIEQRTVGGHAGIDEGDIEVHVVFPARYDNDVRDAEVYTAAVKDMINNNVHLDTDGVQDVSPTAERWGYYMDGEITYITWTLTVTIQLI